MKFTIRSGTDKDHEWLWHLYKDLMRSVVEEQWGWDDDLQLAGFFRNLPASDFSILEQESYPMAAYCVRHKPDHLWLDMMLVGRQFQGSGIGRLIINQLKSEAAMASIPLRLSVIHSNPSLAFYEHLGFTVNQKGEDTSVLSWISNKLL